MVIKDNYWLYLTKNFQILTIGGDLSYEKTFKLKKKKSNDDYN